MGTPSYATKILEVLVNASDIDVILLVTQEDKPVGRKQILTPPDVKQWALINVPSLDIFQPRTLKDTETQKYLASLNPDFIVVAAYGQILPKAVLDIAPCINLHASLLPHYRGASPIQSALLKGEVYTGVTSMLMNEGLDTGDMLGFTYRKIMAEDISETLFESLALDAAALTLKTLKMFDTLQPMTQVHANASHCTKIKKEHGAVSFSDDLGAVVNKFKAFTPWPGIYLESGLKLLEIALFNNTVSSKPYGTILEILSEGCIVAWNGGQLLIKTVQPASKSKMSVIDYLRGKRLSCGDILV